MSTKKYTMVELLVVIAILAILIGITIPSVGYARKRASITQAKSDIANIVTAIKSYESTYHLLPVAIPTTNTSKGTTFITEKPSASDGTNPDYDELVYYLTYTNPTKTTANKLNIRKLRFLELPQGTDPFLDPFKSEDYPDGARYNIIFNSAYDSAGVEYESWKDVSSDTSNRLHGSVFVYSFGPNGKDDKGLEDDITSWDNQ